MMPGPPHQRRKHPTVYFHSFNRQDFPPSGPSLSFHLEIAVSSVCHQPGGGRIELGHDFLRDAIKVRKHGVNLKNLNINKLWHVYVCWSHHPRCLDHRRCIKMDVRGGGCHALCWCVSSTFCTRVALDLPPAPLIAAPCNKTPTSYCLLVIQRFRPLISSPLHKSGLD